MSRIYDNWERLVDATLDREHLRELARCPSLATSSFNSSTSASFSFRSSFDDEPSSDENWFIVHAKDPIAHITVEVIEGNDLKPSYLNGLADPYVKGQLSPYRFRTKTQHKTLAPKWREEFRIPIITWESQNVLYIQVRNKGRFFQDIMGDCSVNINELRGGQRHDLWLPLQNSKMGRLHLAVTVFPDNEKIESL